jgi:biopolymer transport protein ExbD
MKYQSYFQTINITPLTDVMLVLLVIFMVTAPFMDEGRITVELPKTASNQSVESQSIQETIITITQQGEILLGHQVIISAELPQIIENLQGAVQIRCDAKAASQNLIDLLSLLQNAKIDQLKLAVLKP